LFFLYHVQPVQFSRTLDLIDLCSEETQRVLRKRRLRAIKQKDLKRKADDAGVFGALFLFLFL
jgi:hypothetical protein